MGENKEQDVRGQGLAAEQQASQAPAIHLVCLAEDCLPLPVALPSAILRGPTLRISQWFLLLDLMESEALKICPYNPNHRIPANRLQYHLASCKKKNPKIAKKMANCKYNACHVVPIKRLKEHEASCVNRTAIGDEPANLPKFISPCSEPSEKLANAADQTPDPDVWDVDITHRCLFVLQTFTPKMLVCESDSRDLKKETVSYSSKSHKRGLKN